MSVPVALSYKQHPPEGPFDTICIGSGIGSLTTAALLAADGRRVLVLERHYTPGGFTHVFKRKGFEWDVGIHYIGEVSDPHSALRRLFDWLTQGQLQWADLGDVYDQIWFGDERFDLPKGPRQFAAHLKEAFPTESTAIDRYMEAIFATARSARAFFALRALPDLAERVASPFLGRTFLKYSQKTTLQVLQSLTRNQKLIALLTAQYGDYGLPPAESSFGMHAMVVKHYLKGAAYPVGGSGRLVETIAPRIQAAGGAIYVTADVESILVEGGRARGVRMADGRELRAPVVVSGAGAVRTFGTLLPPSTPGLPALRARLAQIPPSASHLCLYVGLDLPAAALGLPRANSWIYPPGAYDHDATLRAYLADESAPLPLIYISFPSAKDPDWDRRHPGKSTIEVITLAPWDRYAPWAGTPWKKRGDAYEAHKALLTDRLLTALHTRLPSTRGHVVHAELSTPLTTQHFTGHPQGEIYGLSHVPSRFRERLLRPATPIPGLYLTGQDTVTAGLGGALLGGILAASAILKKNTILQMLKPGA